LAGGGGENAVYWEMQG